MQDDCIPLAVVTVQMKGGKEHGGGCTVQRICNWTVLRKYTTTFPNLQYWLSFLPFGRLLREALESFCCRQFAYRGQYWAAAETPGRPFRGAGPVGAAPTAAGTGAAGTEATPGEATTGAGLGSPSAFFSGSAPSMARSRAFLQLALQALRQPERSQDAEELVLGVLGQEGPGGEPYLSELESENLLQFIVLDQMAKPLLRAFTPEMAGGVSAVFDTMRGATPGVAPDLERKVAELNETVTQLRATVDELQRRRGPRSGRIVHETARNGGRSVGGGLSHAAPAIRRGTSPALRIGQSAPGAIRHVPPRSE